jgi:hypothetical protein
LKETIILMIVIMVLVIMTIMLLFHQILSFNEVAVLAVVTVCSTDSYIFEKWNKIKNFPLTSCFNSSVELNFSPGKRCMIAGGQFKHKRFLAFS